MANTPGTYSGLRVSLALLRAVERSGRELHKNIRRTLGFFLIAAALAVPLLIAQGSPKVMKVDPASGKVNDSATLTGVNLGKNTVSAVFLSDDKTDYKATVSEQTEQTIVFKVPQTKSGDYNVSIQTGNTIIILPVRFKVE